MLSLLLLIILGFAAFRGVRRGIAYQGVYTLGYLVVFIIATKNYQKLSDKLELLIPYPQPNLDSKLLYYSSDQLFDLDQYFYAGVAFLLILIIGWVIVRFIGIFFYELIFMELLGITGKVLGGILAVFVTMVALSCVLNLLALIPIDMVQQLIDGSGIAKLLIKHVPYFSNKMIELWTQIPVA